MSKILRFITRHHYLSVLFVMLSLALAVFSSGFSSPFMGDDMIQIVNNPPVHSVLNLGEFFTGGTMYDGNGHLTSTYYRPIMTSVFAAIYSIFGPQPAAFHLVQIVVYTLAAFVFYLVLRHFMKPTFALLAALLFLVHPINSQAVYSIATLQEPLYFLFGMLALWILVRYKSTSSVVLAGASLLLSLLSKETGLVFIPIIITYLAMHDRRRLLRFTGILVLYLGIYLALRYNAIGHLANPKLSPIDAQPLWARLLNIPAILVLYVSTFVFPLHMASTNFWVYGVESFQHFWVPLSIIASLALAGLYGLLSIRPKLSSEAFKVLALFLALALFGLLPHLQIFPLDMTACLTWVYVTGAGVIASIFLLLSNLTPPVRAKIVIGIVCAAIAVLGIRSFLRGFDWSSQFNIALIDVKYSENNYYAMNVLASHYLSTGDIKTANSYAERSAKVYMSASTADILARVRYKMGDYAGAKAAIIEGLKNQKLYFLYDDLADLTLVYGDINSNLSYLESAAKAYPNDYKIITALALSRDQAGNYSGAVAAINHAYSLNKSAYTEKVREIILSKQQ